MTVMGGSMGKGAMRVGWALGIGLGLVILWRMLSVYGGGGLPPSFRGGMRPFDSARATQRKAQVADSLTLVLRPKDNNKGTTFAADLDITNRSAATVRDFALACTAVNDLGGVLGRTTTVIHQVLRARRTITVPNVLLEFSGITVKSAKCSIADFTIE
ncbi:MAG: hypothetical protein ACRELE_06905 [Gemmatimonadales bacterium]